MHPAQRRDERFVAETPHLLLFLLKLTYGEVRLLLAATPLAEGHAPDFHHCQAGAGAIRLASHLTRPQLQ
jgi:hypothetical protein